LDNYAWIKYNYDIEESLNLFETGQYIFYDWVVSVREGKTHIFYVFVPVGQEGYGDEPVVITPKNLDKSKAMYALLIAVKKWYEERLKIKDDLYYRARLKTVEEELRKNKTRCILRPHPEVYGYELIFL